MKNYLAVIFLCTFHFVGVSQNNITQAIKGTVVDAQSKYPIIGATIQFVNDGAVIGTSTDIDGNFKLDDIPIGRRAILVRYIGYEEKVIPNILVTSGKESVVNIELEEKLTALEEVVVRANREQTAINSMASGSVRLLSMDEWMN